MIVHVAYTAQAEFVTVFIFSAVITLINIMVLNPFRWGKMSVLHSQINCWWCGESHTFHEVIFMGFDQQRTVAEATILGPYEQELRNGE